LRNSAGRNLRHSPLRDPNIIGKNQFLGSAERRFSVPACKSQRTGSGLRQSWPKAAVQRREAGFTQAAAGATLGQAGRLKPPAINCHASRIIPCVSDLNPASEKQPLPFLNQPS
jgi:hypothetical protein